MKKLVFLAVFLLAATALFAQDLSSLPTGSWVDPNWDATWTFGATGIVLSTPKDGTIYTFTTRNIQGLKAATRGATAGINFSCEGTGRTYTFLAALDGTITMQIERAGLPDYEVKMQKK